MIVHAHLCRVHDIAFAAQGQSVIGVSRDGRVVRALRNITRQLTQATGCKPARLWVDKPARKALKVDHRPATVCRNLPATRI